MMFRLIPLVFLFCCSCSKTNPIAKYEGEWESPPFKEMFEDAIVEEMIPAIRDGSFPDIEKMRGEDPKKFEDLLKKSDEELGEYFSKFLGFQNMDLDLRFGITVSSDSRFRLSAIINGEKSIVKELHAQFEVTEREIFVRSTDETEVIYIEEDHLKIRNENRGDYPKFIRFYRVVTGAKH